MQGSGRPKTDAVDHHRNPNEAPLNSAKHRYAMLRHATPCYAMLRHATPCYAMLRHATPCYATLRHATPCYAMLRHATPCYAMLRRYDHCQIRATRRRKMPKVSRCSVKGNLSSPNSPKLLLHCKTLEILRQIVALKRTLRL